MDFVDRLSEPDNEELVQVIKRFLLSVLGPRGDGSAPSIYSMTRTQTTHFMARTALKDEFLTSTALWIPLSGAQRLAGPLRRAVP